MGFKMGGLNRPKPGYFCVHHRWCNLSLTSTGLWAPQSDALPLSAEAETGVLACKGVLRAGGTCSAPTEAERRPPLNPVKVRRIWRKIKTQKHSIVPENEWRSRSHLRSFFVGTERIRNEEKRFKQRPSA